jgi:hypothetical protein
MDDVLCPECGIPKHVTDEHSWLSDGIIVQSRHKEHRMVLIESENFDSLFKGIGELIGLPIEHIVVNVARRATRAYIDRLVTEEAREMLQKGDISPEAISVPVLQVGRAMGYGAGTLSDVRFDQKDDDYVTVRYEHPYSIPLTAGNITGTIEVLMGRPGGVTFKEIPPDALEVTVFPLEHPSEMKDRLFFRPLQAREGNIDLSRCGTCDCPSALSEFKWDLDNGIIRSEVTHRRMALIGAAMVDPIFEELEKELGTDIPEVVIEAQRRFVRGGYYSVSEVRGEPRMREVLALRGMGELLELKLGRKGVELRLANAALPLMGVGLTQGLYELAFGIESRVTWSFSEEGLLEVSVSPWD